MKNRFYNAVIFTIIIILFLSSAVHGNSSWHWVTTSPMTVLPFAIIFTLIIETTSVVKVGSMADTRKVLKVVGLANLMSFLAPYLERAYRFRPVAGGFSLSAAFNKGPYYMILSGYLFLTILVELPVVYYFLSKETSNKKKLIAAIILSNIITTLLVAVCERMICIGRW
ncbi:hypothetical protein [Lutispora sp.]|uniref:hypothetical protein n=1 Tax=Lutispora sp. TaxID=2828727 RepID=UPI00356AE33E